MYYRFDVRFNGYATVCVDAANLDAAEEQALAKFEEKYRTGSLWDLRNKTIELDFLDNDK